MGCDFQIALEFARMKMKEYRLFVTRNEELIRLRTYKIHAYETQKNIYIRTNIEYMRCWT